VDRTDPLADSNVEVGCGFGATTVFLDCHLRDIGSDKRYYALDTFGGFAPEDVAVGRGRGRGWDYLDFRNNSKASFELTMELNRVRRVAAIKADAKNFRLHDNRPALVLSFRCGPLPAGARYAEGRLGPDDSRRSDRRRRLRCVSPGAAWHYGGVCRVRRRKERAVGHPPHEAWDHPTVVPRPRQGDPLSMQGDAFCASSSPWRPLLETPRSRCRPASHTPDRRQAALGALDSEGPSEEVGITT
jgi:hypothetical protein